ncbi:hypothetical protein HNY73_001756 [Argiope bruennichi]|uniref:Uncharacterized protein n=1 Tax=Argiope bruennichi TaxID=94029 RepID=A0A8T0FRJ0_ARGBR|nr:hypothetical protein HNY73_001756 [Argiope bruennichi]
MTDCFESSAKICKNEGQKAIKDLVTVVKELCDVNSQTHKDFQNYGTCLQKPAFKLKFTLNCLAEYNEEMQNLGEPDESNMEEYSKKIRTRRKKGRERQWRRIELILRPMCDPWVEFIRSRGRRGEAEVRHDWVARVITVTQEFPLQSLDDVQQTVNFILIKLCKNNCVAVRKPRIYTPHDTIVDNGTRPPCSCGKPPTCT